MENKETLISYWKDYLVKKGMDNYHAKETAIVFVDEIEEVYNRSNHELDLNLVKEFGFIEQKEPVDIVDEEKDYFDNRFVEKLIKELPEYGIDTSEWEYDYGDCCYGGATEFISRCIKGYSEKQRQENQSQS